MSISKASERYIARLLTISSMVLFLSHVLDAQTKCDFASDFDFETTSGITTLSVHSDLCYTMDEKLVVTCIDNNNVPSRDTFYFDECSATPPSNDNRALNISEFSAEVDLSGCSAVEVLYPDGSVGYYEIIADDTPESGTDFSGFFNLQFCEDECLMFSVVDTWGALVGTAQGQPCCIDGNIIFTESCTDCQDLGGFCDPEPGDCSEYGSVDFGCVEIDRSSTRTFYVNSCPFVQDNIRPLQINGSGGLNTGIIECNYNLDDRLALAVDHCEIIIYDIQIHPEHMDDFVVKNGPVDLPFSLVGDFEFPITLKRGDNLPFQVKYVPFSYGYDEAVVTICYENDCECDREFEDPERQALEDGLHCETSKWYDFRVYGEGKDCQEILGNGDCTRKCPECIFTPESLQTNGAGGGGPCGGYFEYTIGYAGAGPPPTQEPVGRNGFSCGDLYLDTQGNGQLYIFDEGSGIPPVRVPGEGGWIPTPPAPYGLGFFNLECSQGSKFSLPYVPYLFFDNEDAELYLVPGYGQPVEQVDMIVSIENSKIVTRNGGYANCGDYEPGDLFYIYPDVDESKINAAVEPVAYEFIACDGYRLFAKLAEDTAEPLLSCSFYAEFPSTFTMGYYGSYTNGTPVKDNGCYSWLNEYCALTRTDLLVVHNEADEGYDELICNLFDVPFRQPEEICHPYADYGCIVQGSTKQKSFDLLHCSDDFRSIDIDRNQNNTREDEMDIDCDYFKYDDDITFGQGCEITIHFIEILDYGEDELMRNGYSPSEHFSLAQPMTFPVTISFEEYQEMLINYTPTEPGDHQAKVRICYENSCSSCFESFIGQGALENGDQGSCFYETFEFYLEGCSFELSNMDEDLDGELEVIDPCACEDPENVYGNPGGMISLFHDFISVGGSSVDPLDDVELEITGGELYDENNVPLIRNGNGRITIPYDGDLGNHFIEFWTEPGVGFTGVLWIDGQMVDDPVAMLESICEGPCAPIPTIGEWGIIVLSMMLLILGLVGLRQPRLKPQLIRK